MEKIPPLPDDVLDLGRRLVPAPVFLVGCARSGTSIFGEALAAHPRVAYLFELKLWNDLLTEGDDHRLDESAATPEVAESVYKALAAASDAECDILLEKNPKHVIRIPLLRALFPWGRFLHILRDGRDTIASLMFRNRGDRWGHLKIPGWRSLLERYPEENHIRCAHQWRDAVALARRDAEELNPQNYLEVGYEGLLRQPSMVIQKTLDFLGLPAAPEVDAFLGKIQDSTTGSYHARRQIRHYLENHSRRVGRYRENLTEEQLAEVMGVCGGLLRELGYT